MLETRIPLGKKSSVLVDADDYAHLAAYKWHDDGKPGYCYPARVVTQGGKRTRFPMLRAIFPGLRPNERVTFRNGDRTDLRRENLIIEGRIGEDSSTLEKGAIGEMAVCLDLMRQGYQVFLPFHGHSPYDLIASDPEHKLYRVQVKHKSINQGRINVALSTVHTNGQGMVKKAINRSHIDVLAVFCPQTDEAYYVGANELPNTALTIRVLDPKSPNPRTKTARNFRSMARAIGATEIAPNRNSKPVEDTVLED